MKKHHTKNKGDYGILKVQLDLYEQGFVVFTTTSEHQDFDLIAYKEGGNFKRIQVKYRSLNSIGTLGIKFSNSWADKNGNHSSFVDKNEIDYYAIYCPETNECYYIDPKEFNNTLNLRIIDSINGQTKNVKYARNYKKLVL